jgi:hypothetical protein
VAWLTNGSDDAEPDLIVELLDAERVPPVARQQRPINGLAM